MRDEYSEIFRHEDLTYILAWHSAAFTLQALYKSYEFRPARRCSHKIKTVISKLLLPLSVPNFLFALCLGGLILTASEKSQAAEALDAGFGTGGIGRLGWETLDEVHAMALQNDGKIVLAGNSGNGNASDFTLARLNHDGSPDAAFGIEGRVTVDFSKDYYDGALCLVIQPDGKILAAGNKELIINTLSYSYIVMARFNQDGGPDMSFGAQGRVTTDIPGRFTEFARAITLQQDGKIIVGAVSGTGDNLNFTLLRHHSDGTLDSTFGTDGIRSTSFAGSPRVVTLQPDGGILVAGDTWLNNDVGDFTVARFLPDGKTDTAFGNGGGEFGLVLRGLTSSPAWR